MIRNKIKKNWYYILVFIVITIMFFMHYIIYFWDSTEYLGMSMALKTKSIRDVWLPHRGLTFPLILKLFTFGTYNKHLLLLMLYLFFLAVFIVVIKIGKNTKIFADKNEKVLYLVWSLLFLILNPFIFVYYHALLTEFIAMSMSVIFVYLLWKWTDNNILAKTKSIIGYTCIFSLILVCMYHTKQSFIAMMILEFLLGLIISIIKKINVKNVLVRLSTFLICIVLLVLSIKMWNNYMYSRGVKDVEEKTEAARVSKRLLYGLNELEEVGNNQNLTIVGNKFLKLNGAADDKAIYKILLNKSDKEEIKKIMEKKSKYKGFTVYQYKEKKQYVLFTKRNYSLKEQIPLFVKIVLKNPFLAIKSYIKGYYEVVWSSDKEYHYENMGIVRYYLVGKGNNLPNYNEDYLYAMEGLVKTPKRTIFDKFLYGLTVVFWYLYRINQLLLPFLFIFSIIIYIIIWRKKEQYFIKRGFELIILLFGMAISCIMSYIIFGALIDRYLMPSHIPMFMGDVLLIIYLYRLYIKKYNNVIIR